MHINEKLKLPLTLDGYEAALLKRAAAILEPENQDISDYWSRRSFRRLIRFALWAYLRAVIANPESVRDGELLLAAALRKETPAELAERLNGKLPGSNSADWRAPNRWN